MLHLSFSYKDMLIYLSGYPIIIIIIIIITWNYFKLI
jgi:hypothetical protein